MIKYMSKTIQERHFIRINKQKARNIVGGEQLGVGYRRRVGGGVRGGGRSSLVNIDAVMISKCMVGVESYHTPRNVGPIRINKADSLGQGYGKRTMAEKYFPDSIIYIYIYMYIWHYDKVLK